MKKISKISSTQLIPKTFVASARCDIKDIAVIAYHYIENLDIIPVNRSQIISASINHLATIFKTEFKIKELSSSDAQKYLKRFNLAGKSIDTLRKAIVSEANRNLPLTLDTERAKVIMEKINSEYAQKIANEDKTEK